MKQVAILAGAELMLRERLDKAREKIVREHEIIEEIGRIIEFSPGRIAIVMMYFENTNYSFEDEKGFIQIRFDSFVTPEQAVIIQKNKYPKEVGFKAKLISLCHPTDSPSNPILYIDAELLSLEEI